MLFKSRLRFKGHDEVLLCSFLKHIKKILWSYAYLKILIRHELRRQKPYVLYRNTFSFSLVVKNFELKNKWGYFKNYLESFCLLCTLKKKVICNKKGNLYTIFCLLNALKVFRYKQCYAFWVTKSCLQNASRSSLSPL